VGGESLRFIARMDYKIKGEKKMNLDKVLLGAVCVYGLLLLGFGSYIIGDLDKKVKAQIEEINRQQAVIAIQQTEIDSYKMNELTEDEKKLLKDYR
jgi:hypothetical protein